MILDQYPINLDGTEIPIVIESAEEHIKEYDLKLPEFSPATQALVEHVKSELISKIKISSKEVIDPKSIEHIRNDFIKEAKQLITGKIPGLSEKDITFTIGYLLNELTGLGKIEYILEDPNLEEIVVPGSAKRIMVFHKKHGWCRTNVIVKTEDQIQNYSNIIARRVGRQVSILNPLLDAHLITGDRTNAVLYPISSFGNTITIRKFARDPWTFVDFISNGTCNSGVFAIIWLAFQYEMNVLFSGGTASGKTSMLNVCMPFIPLNQRIISIEDTRELQLPKYLFWNPLVTRVANPDGKGEVSMLDLLVNSLRMRPDRIILGEVRKGEDAMVLFEAMHTGHSVYATVHADSASETIARLTNPPISVPPNLLHAVDLNVVMFRDRRLGRRRIYQISEFIVDKDDVKSNILYRWIANSDKIVTHSNSLTFFEKLSRHTGLNQEDITKDIMQKKKILDWLVNNKITGIDKISEIMKKYYLNQKNVEEYANSNKNPADLLK